MVFSSSVFLLVFLPLVLVAYFVIPSRAAKNFTFACVSCLLCVG